MKVALIGATGFVGSVILREALDRGSVLSAEGADDNIMVRYRKEAFETKLKNFDAVFDTIGGETMERSLKVLKQGGILV